jgi:hypothetical protein
MLLKYARKQRASIYHPATIDDLPFEVLREAFLYLDTEDLTSPSRVNRSWRPAAQDVQKSKLMISPWDGKRLDASLMCGIQLSRIVFGCDAFSIKHLTIDVCRFDRDYLPILARLISTTLRSLDISFNGVSEFHYETLDQFFSRYHGIRNLKLAGFDFGVDPASFTKNIKDGFYRLSQLSFEWCRGDHSMFIEIVPIPNLKILRLYDDYNSSATLLKFVECCRDIEKLSFESDDVILRGPINRLYSPPEISKYHL